MVNFMNKLMKKSFNYFNISPGSHWPLTCNWIPSFVFSNILVSINYRTLFTLTGA